jgi:hypothetical protein
LREEEKTVMKKTNIMLAACVAAAIGLAGFAFTGTKTTTPAVYATNGLTLNLTSSNGPTAATDSGVTYTWNTDTSNGYHTTWEGSGITYDSSFFLHIALNNGEFHNTITLHQITNLVVNGYESGSTTGTLDLFAASTAAGLATATKQTVSNGVAATFDASANIGFIKLQYNRADNAKTNYITSIALTYNCVA